MRKSNTNGATNKKYWEAETPIVTETTFAEIRYYKDAGKIQLYPLYEDKNGEMQLGRGCVWDNNEISSEESVALVYGLMRALLDSGIENDAFSDAYAILDEAMGNDSDEDEKLGKQTDDEDEYEEELDEDFEDEEDVEANLNELSNEEFAEVWFECMGRKSKVTSKNRESLTTRLLEACDEDTIMEAIGYSDEDDEEEETTSTEFVGKKLIYKDGEVSKATKRVKKVYMEWAEDAIEWATYIVEATDELKEMPTKTPKQKKAQNSAYDELKDNVAEWEESWGEEVYDEIYAICKDLMMSNLTLEEGICKFVAIIDGMEL